MLTTHFVSNDPISEDRLQTGLQTAFHDVGSGDAFVLVHGFTGSKLDFADQLPWFATTHRVLAYDQRGHGESSNTGPYTLYGLVADLIGFLDAAGIERCHILGHSLGGMVVLRALIAHPMRFQSAVLMDTAPYGLSLFDANVREQLNTLVTRDGCEALLQGMQGQPQNAAIQRGIDCLGEQEHWRRIRVKLEQMDPAAFVELGSALSDQPSVLSNLSSLSLPTTIIVGEQDEPFIKPSVDMANAMPHADLVRIADAGHSPQYENAEAWQTALEAHLSRAAV